MGMRRKREEAKKDEEDDLLSFLRNSHKKKANIYQFVDAGLAVPPRQDAQNGFVHVELGNGLANGVGVSEDISDQQQFPKQTKAYESSNEIENRTNIEEVKL